MSRDSMQYVEHPVPEDLRGHLACVWHLVDAAPAGVAQTIYPDGCCELIVHLGVPPRAWDPQRGWHDQAATLFAAQHLGPVRLLATEPLNCIGLRLQPEASTMLGARSRFRDRIVDLADIDVTLSRQLERAAQAFAKGSKEALWPVVRRIVARQPIDARVSKAVSHLRDSGGSARIEGLARSLGCSLRTLQTRFRRQVGLTPKEFARVMRLRATLRALDTSDSELVDIAADLNFADQAHISRETRRITGLAPARLRAALRKDRDGETAARLAAAFVRGRA
jgi:AraC-like DNA-binding protein